MSLGGVGHVDLMEGFFGLTDCPLMCEGRISSHGRRTYDRIFWGEVVLLGMGHGGFWFLY